MDVFPSKPPFGRSIIQPLCALAFLAVRKAAFSCLHHFARIVNWRILKINEFCKFTSTDKTMMTLSSPFNPLAWNAVVMASAKKTNPPRRIPNQKKTFSSTAPMARMPSIRCILGAKNFRNMIFMGVFLLAVLGK